MLSEKQIERINELARKARSGGLTQTEKDEQVLLRAAYLSCVRDMAEDVFDRNNECDRA